MKALTLALLVATPFIASAQQRPSVAGKWAIHSNIMGNESDRNCTISATGADLKGTCDGAGVLTGKLDGTTMTWEIKSEYNGAPITLDYKGTLDASGKLTGTVTVVEYSVDGEYTAKLVK